MRAMEAPARAVYSINAARLLDPSAAPALNPAGLVDGSQCHRSTGPSLGCPPAGLIRASRCVFESHELPAKRLPLPKLHEISAPTERWREREGN